MIRKDEMNAKNIALDEWDTTYQGIQTEVRENLNDKDLHLIQKAESAN